MCSFFAAVYWKRFSGYLKFFKIVFYFRKTNLIHEDYFFTFIAAFFSRKTRWRVLTWLYSITTHSYSNQNSSSLKAQIIHLIYLAFKLIVCWFSDIFLTTQYFSNNPISKAVIETVHYIRANKIIRYTSISNHIGSYFRM